MSPLSIPNSTSSSTAEVLAQAAPDSVDFSILAGTFGAVVSGCAVTAQSSPNATVQTAAGTVVVAGVSYVVTSTPSSTITANASGNPRLDLVIYRVGTGVMVLAGTAGAAPFTAFPTPTAATDVVLAAVYVANSFTTITNAEIIDKRFTPVALPTPVAGIYGDGSDGAHTFDGSTVILGITPSSSVYTMNRDWFLGSCTINSGVTIDTHGYRVFCNGTLTFTDATSIIRHNGGSGAGGGTAATSGTVNNPPGNGGGGGSASNGQAAASPSLGGAGGNSGSNTNTGGAAAPPTAGQGSARALPVAVLGYAMNNLGAYVGFTAGAGGAGGTTTAGGAGGGYCVVCAFQITGTGSIQANGGAGANSTTHGAGGGGGGTCVVVSSSASGGAVSGITIDANGGAGGTGTAAVAAGSNGTVLVFYSL